MIQQTTFTTGGSFLDVGRAIKLCRSQKGWTLIELGKRTGIAASHLSMIERGQRDPSMKTMEAIASVFNMPLNVLIFLAAEPKELVGMSDELKEKLSRAALELLRLPTSGHLF